MNNVVTVSEQAPVTLTSREMSAQPRFDLYRAPHKGLRYILCHLLLSMGQASFAVKHEALCIVEAIEVVLRQCDLHIAHEDEHIHPALVARMPNALATLDREHDEHATQVAELRAMVKAMREAADDGHRAAIGRTLYLHFSIFVAETLAHMAYEERVVQPLLDRHFTFQEQLGFQIAIVTTMSPEATMEFLRMAIPASSRAERVELLEGGRAMMPPAAFEAVVDDLLPLLGEKDAADLVLALGL